MTKNNCSDSSKLTYDQIESIDTRSVELNNDEWAWVEHAMWCCPSWDAERAIKEALHRRNDS
jgi:hypothetical protein